MDFHNFWRQRDKKMILDKKLIDFDLNRVKFTFANIVLLEVAIQTPCHAPLDELIDCRP